MRKLSRLTNDGALDALVEKAMKAFNALTPEEQRAHRREQAISWVYGETKLEDESSTTTREEIADLVDRKARPALRVVRPLPETPSGES